MTTETDLKHPTNTKTFRISAWLGWLIQSNWTDPFVFAIYSLIVPMAGAAILVVMYMVIRGGNFSDPDFLNIFIGNAFSHLANGVIQGVSYGILDDREHYRTLKYLYIAPIRIPVYLIGRSVATVLVSMISVILILIFGVVFLHIPLSLASVNWGLLLIALLLGMICFTAMGIFLGGWTLLIKNNPYDLGTVVGTGLFLFSGAIFPLSVLPTALRYLGYALPLAYWYTLLRRALLGEIGRSFPMFTGLSDGQLVLILAGFALLTGGLALLTYGWFDKTARDRGNIDMISNY